MGESLSFWDAGLLEATHAPVDVLIPTHIAVALIGLSEVFFFFWLFLFFFFLAHDILRSKW